MDAFGVMVLSCLRCSLPHLRQLAGSDFGQQRRVAPILLEPALFATSLDATPPPATKARQEPTYSQIDS